MPRRLLLLYSPGGGEGGGLSVSLGLHIFNTATAQPSQQAAKSPSPAAIFYSQLKIYQVRDTGQIVEHIERTQGELSM